NSGPDILGGLLRRKASPMMNDLTQPADEVLAWRNSILGSRQIQMGMGVDQSWENCHVAQVEIRPSCASSFDRLNALSKNGDRATLERWSDNGKDPASG